MKKILLLLIIGTIGLLNACDFTAPIDENNTVPQILGVSDVTILYGSYFDPFEGITAVDDIDGDIIYLITVHGLESLELNEGIVTSPGTYTLNYRVMNSLGRSALAARVVTVLHPGTDIDPDPNDDLTPPDLENCGNPVIGDYIITWCDEFDGSGTNLNAHGVDLDKWAFQTGTGTQYGLTGWGNNEAQYYLESNARVEEGRLIIEAKRENHGNMNYTSARLWTKPTFYQLYGRFEAKIKLPVGEGLWPAFWMMPQFDVYGGWAASGEIDIMEARGRFPDRSIAALHFGGAWPHNTHTHQVYYFPTGRTIADFNVYAVEWEEGIIRWYVNDVLIKTATNWHTDGHTFPAPFDQEFYLLLNLAIGGSFDGGMLPPDSLFDEPVLMEIEYVRVYQKNQD
ncbi:family 16 glycosylhydrolase [Liberiplasma polymorphum]|uniref:family 16 glycosylhydrolase n=1 Tax=Liberiplasma polymorphum TaxID=3374570 RepID=UPI003771FDB3